MSGRSAQCSKKSAKKVVLSHARQIYNYVKVDELIPELVNPELSFVTNKELERLHGIYGDSNKARELLLILKKKGSLANCKFVACLMLEPEHTGHKELAQELIDSIPQKEKDRIKKIIDSATVTSEKAYNVEKPLPHIELQGYLKGHKFDLLNGRLWHYLQKGQYDSFYQITNYMRDSSGVVEYQILGLWFESVAYIHNDSDHEKCVSNLLLPALALCKDPVVTNQTILEGRLHQRLSQVLLLLGKKKEALNRFHMAESRLQFVGRGYDRVQLLLRNAKILSSMSLSDAHGEQRIEMMYASALDCISDSDPFAFSCRPSLYLSKAAFHLGMSFGSKLSLTTEPPGTISNDKIRKAKDAMTALSRGNVRPISIRQCEQSLVEAELLRLEGGVSDALEAFESAKQRSAQKGLTNLVSIAEHRIKYLEHEKIKTTVLDELIQGYSLGEVAGTQN